MPSFSLLLRAALPAILLVLACSCRKPALREGERESVRIEFTGADGPRTPEGARLTGEVALGVEAQDGLRLGPEELDAALREEARAWLESALSRGLGAARDADPAPLRARLAERGLKLTDAKVVRLDVPGGERRAELAPTTDLRILVIGLDAYDWDIADPLLASGRLPVLRGLVERGTRARLQTIPPVLSPVVWTSMATSRHPQDHGILDFLGTDAQGNAVPVTSNLRKVKAFWNVLGDAGVDTGVVGWWATWPAEPVRGFMVSDRVAYQLFGLDAAALPSPGKVYPSSLWPDVERLIVRPRDVSQDELREFLSPSPRPPDAQDRELMEQFSGVLAQSRTYAAVGLHLHETRKPRVGAYYFEAPDTACHLFMRYAPPPLPEIDRARQQRYQAVVDRTYELHDRILGRFLELADEKTVVLVVSDHGFRSGAARPTKDSRVETPNAADWHERMGVLVAAGPGIVAGKELAEASILDVFPTMLALLGMPVADDLAGRVLTEALTPEFQAAHPVRRVPTFETGEAREEAAFAEASPEDRAILEQLVAIGYVSPAALGPAGGAPGATGAAGGASAQSAANAHNNLGTVLLQQGDLDPAEAEFRKVVAAAPDFVPGHVNLAHVLIRQGRPEEAEAALKRAVALEPTNPRALSLMASLQLSAGRIAEAEAVARSAVAHDERSAAGWFTLGQVLEKAGRGPASREAYERAATLDPDNPEPLNAIGNALEAAGAYAEAATWYAKALATDPTYAAAYNNLALQQQRLGQWDRALATYEEGRRRLPKSSILLNNIATWHHLKAQEALARARELQATDAAGAARARTEGEAAAERATSLYREAMEADGLDASPWNNLGALEGERGRAEEQLKLYRRAVEINPSYADAWHNIGLWNLDRARNEEALEAFDKALQARPDSEPSLQMAALALVRLGRPQDAARRLEAAASARATPSLLATLGSVYESLGRRDDACRRYREALRLAPGLPELQARAKAACGS